jgi:LacI family transcriptional regulator/LacI family fructose operon transcriptional repressor/LacI family repressor for deo operon, udp, cdd, tsx, nupC, and nupG
LLAQHPNTVFYEDPGIEDASYVTVDRALAMRLAVRHMLERGRKRIGLAVMSLSRPGHIDRREGYEQELIANGVTLDPRLIFNAEPLGDAIARCNEDTSCWDFPIDIAEATIDRLVRDQHADAIIAHDDYWAAVLVRRLRARGINVPGHVAVVGYLNHYLCDWTDPPLTTIDLNHHEAARQMVTMLERMINEGPLPSDERIVKVAPRLVLRESA